MDAPLALARFCRVLAGAPASTDAVGFRSVHSESGAGAFFGPSEDAERRFSELKRVWAELEDAGVPAKYSNLHRQRETWVAFRAAWEAGNPDVTMLTAAEVDARIARAYVREHQPEDPRFAKSLDPQGGEIENATAALKAAASTDQGAKAVEAFAEDAVRDAAKSVAKTASRASSFAWDALSPGVKAGAVVAVVGVGYVAARAAGAYLSLITGGRRVYA